MAATEFDFTLNSRTSVSVGSRQYPNPNAQEQTMSDRKMVRLDLTEEQKAQVKAATGQNANAVELSVEELEERIAPRTLYS
jgi:hypothetical protein